MQSLDREAYLTLLQSLLAYDAETRKNRHSKASCFHGHFYAKNNALNGQENPQIGQNHKNQLKSTSNVNLISFRHFLQRPCCWETVSEFLIDNFSGNELPSAECFVEFFLFLFCNMCLSCVKADSAFSPPQNTTNSSVK